MNIRTMTAGAAAVALTALLLPALETGAQASPRHGHRPTKPGCSVVAIPSKSSPGADHPVLLSAAIEHEPTNPEYAASAGHYLDTTYHPYSSTFRATIAYTPPSKGGCGSISLRTSPVVGSFDEPVLLDPVQTTTVHPSGEATEVVITSLVVGLPAHNLFVELQSGPHAGEKAYCVGTQVEVRDEHGTVVQTFPSAGPQVDCPGNPGGKVYGG